jgi:hypothetical protein
MGHEPVNLGMERPFLGAIPRSDTDGPHLQFCEGTSAPGEQVGATHLNTGGVEQTFDRAEGAALALSGARPVQTDAGIRSTALQAGLPHGQLI